MNDKLNNKILSVESDYTEAPEKEIISISRINDASCPQRYYKNYVESPKQEIPFESIELGLGRFFHKEVEELFRRIQFEDRAISDKDTLPISKLLNSFRLKFMLDGKLREPYRIIKSEQSFQDFEKRLSGIAKYFNKFINKELIGHQIFGIEGKIQITTERCFLRGKYDLITKKEDSMNLWDWKTGKEPNQRYYDSFRSQKIQIGFYATWLRHKTNIGDIQGSSVFLRDKIAWLSEIYDVKTEVEVLKYMVGWRDKLNRLLVYPQKQSPLCKWCPWSESKECRTKSRWRHE